MDVNLILTIVGIIGSMVAFSWGIIKHLTSRIDHGHDIAMQRISDTNNEINIIKREFVSDQRFTDTMNSMSATVQNIQTEIREQRTETREQNDRLFALLNRRRDDG